MYTVVEALVVHSQRLDDGSVLRLRNEASHEFPHISCIFMVKRGGSGGSVGEILECRRN